MDEGVDPRISLEEEDARRREATQLAQLADANLEGGPGTDLNPKDLIRQDMEILFDLAIQGALPRNRPLRSYEPQKLNATHLRIVMMRAAGLRNSRICEETGESASFVSITLNHPDSQFLLGRMMALGAARSADIGEQMEALCLPAKQVLEEVLYDEKAPKALRVKVAFGILDRRDYGEKKKLEVDHKFNISGQEAHRLRTAIAEARELVGVNYRVHVVNGPEGSQSLGSGTASSGAGMPPTSSPQVDEEAA